MTAIRVAATFAAATFATVLLTGTAALPGESLGDRLSAPMSISDLSGFSYGWGADELPDRRRELIGLIRDGSYNQAQNAALLLRGLEQPFIGVATVSLQGAATFTDDAMVIYERMTRERTDPGLALTLDELLMSGSDMLFTFLGAPIRSVGFSGVSEKGGVSGFPVYGPVQIDKGCAQIGVLEGIARDFPLSRFAPFSEWAVGDTYIEMFLYAEKHNSEFLVAAVSTYDRAFRSKLQQEVIEDQPSGLRLFDDLGVRLTLALILSGDVVRARDTLAELEKHVVPNAPESEEIDQIYVDYHLPFLGEPVATILNTGDFLTHLRAYLDSADPFDPVRLAEMDPPTFAEALQPFADHLAAFENHDFKIIFLSSKSPVEIAAKLAEFQSSIDAAEIGVQLQSVGGDPWHGIATPGTYTRSEAEALRQQLTGVRLPSDAYLWRPGER